MSDPLTSALACLDDYMAGLNRVMKPRSMPLAIFRHVRLAGGTVGVWEKSGDYSWPISAPGQVMAGITAPGTNARRSMSARTRCISR